MKTQKMKCKPPSPGKLALCIASALALGGVSEQAVAAGCSYTTTAQLFCDNTTIYHYGNPLGGDGRDYTGFDEVRIDTTSEGTTTGLTGWGVYIDNIGYKFKNLVINTTGTAADGIHSKNAGGKLVADNIYITATGSSADGINIGRELQADYSIVEVNGNVTVDAENGMGLRANASANKDNAQSSIIIHGNTDIVTRGPGGMNTGYGIYAGRDPAQLTGTARGNADITLNGTTSVTTSGRSAHAVYVGRKGTINLNNIDLKTSGATAHGVYASSSTESATVNLGGDTKIQVTDSGAYAIYAYGSQATIRSWDYATDTADSGVYDIKGNLRAYYGGTMDLHMEDGSRFVGKADSSQENSNANYHGSLDLSMKGASSEWTMTGNSVVSNLTLDQATLRYSPDGVSRDDAGTFKTLTVIGNYIGTNALLVLNTVLEGDGSLTDMLKVNGDTSGNTKVGINNIGGVGELTVNGIKIVEVAGNSDGTFTKSGRIVAGAYDYDVVKKASDWYLTSELSPVDPPPVDPPPVDPEPEPDPDPAQPDPEDPPGPPVYPGPDEHQYRPEFGSYLANNYAANTLFITRLHDRLGETQYTDMLTGEEKVTTMWMRNVGGHNRFTDGSGQLKTTANRYVLQLGGDLAQWSSDGLDRWHLGAMAGYANQKSKTHNSYTGYASRGQVDGYSVGLYATWYANEADKTGTYLDSWVLYNWFDNTVRGDHLASENYKSDGITASVEGGYSFLVGESENKTYWIQPKAQVIWMDVQADSHREHNGTLVKDKTDGNLMTRLGVRAYLKGHAEKDADKGRDFQPFIEANWIHNTNNQTVQMGSIKDEISGTRNIGELKVGIEGQINPRLQVWGNVAQQVGDNSYSDTSAMLGVKYSF
ncbi:autotransporter outer membrane beta-barrel domain-containing protein [Citrobacter farmeri]|uniref:autotransporter outer membrane beta-barrel domain-containing protein n=1 Tax=Citrobacter farmeri TaxID=67824 RepID=UPI00189DFABD|nr:autotransporter outer membrane beta-barrel domain-containing protein [Citrobacter farmeri]MDZ7531280.1 autotransporter outer membrane beta-barrel domain-containing protein [Citrobacter farmeri]HCD2001857.1 autotransporter outer membrane beta-barrel domain-containing protein [Citrobacter farmeri]